jgi:hypothetical protein
VTEPLAFTVLVLSIWIDGDGRPLVRVLQKTDRDDAESRRTVQTLPELLEAVEGWAAPLLDAPDPASWRLMRG